MSRVHWRRELLYLLVMAMDICWLAPLVSVISGLLSHSAIPALALAALYVAAFWSGRLLVRLELDPLRSRILVIYLAVTSILVAEKALHYPAFPWLDAGWVLRLAMDLIQMARVTPPAALTLVCGVGLWWAGLRLSGQQATRGLVTTHFSAGLVIFVFVLILAAMRPLPDTSVAIFAFFFCGLLAVSLARLEGMPSAQQPAVDRYWLAILLPAIAVVLGGAALVVAILAIVGGAGESALAALSGLTGLLAQILLLLLTPFGYLAQWLVMLFEWVLGGAVRTPGMQYSAPAPPLDPEGTAPTQLPFILEQVLRALPPVLFLLLAGWLLIRALSRRRAQAEEANGEYRESIGGLSSLWGDLVGFLGGLWARLAGQARQRLSALATSGGPEASAALSVRQIYAKLLRLAARLGPTRRPDQTPLEYLPDLERTLPEARADVSAVTAAYVRARYSAHQPSPDDLDRVRAAWERIKAVPTSVRR